MKRRISIPLLFISCCCFANILQAQVTNIRSNHDTVNEKFIITYDLAKENRYSYFDIDVLVIISGIEVRPSLAALAGDMGLNIKFGSKKRIVWDYLIDIEKIVGDVKFKVQARRPALPPPPSQHVDIIAGSSLVGVGLGFATFGGLTLLKKGKIDLEATPNRDPMLYYYTFCDAESQYFDITLAEVEDENSPSLCDSYFESANDEYREGIRRLSIGGALIAGGIIVLLTKPFYRPKMKAYRKKHGLTLTPTLDWQLSPASVPEGIVVLQLRYKFGK